MTWNNRIIGYGESAPDDLLANPNNWRVHPKYQQDALGGALTQIGWIAPVIVNQRTGYVVDGHLRVALAISNDEPAVPIAFVDLTDEEEQIALATFDPITSLAVTDEQILASLMDGITIDTPALETTVNNLLYDDTDPLADSEAAQPTDDDRNALLWGYTTFGRTKVACSATEVDALQQLYDSYKQEHGIDAGFVRWLAEGQPDD